MASIGERELREQIKTKTFSNAYFIYGEESYLKEYYVGEMKKKIVDATFESFNYHSYEGKNTSIDEILRNAQMLPMMSEYNFLIVYDYPFFASGSETAAKEVKEFLKDLPDTTVIIFLFEAVAVDIKGSSKWKSLANAFAKVGSTVNLAKRTEGDLIKLIESGTVKRKATITKENARYLLSIVGSDMKTLMNELDKITMYVNGGEISRKIIDEMATKCLQAKIFDLTKAVIRGDADTSYYILDTLLQTKEEPIAILAVISNTYVDMYRVKCARIAGNSASDVGNYFNYRGREFVLGNAATSGNRLSIETLRSSLDAISESDEKLKSTSVAPRLILEETIIKLMMIAEGA